ncbi:MAG: hypothetical protein QOF51_1847 [Chloroflexota bacterium]|nr:hypothetical protein [Chloroflexota bacterium]
MAASQTCTVTGSNGNELVVRIWPAPTATATVCICHGMGEHGGRYEWLASRLNAEGWTVIAPDHRGHGRSAGRRGYVERWRQYVDDFHTVIQAVADPALPRAVLGQSMGGLIAIGYALAYGDTLCALVLTSPLLQLARPLSPLRAATAIVLSRLLPWFSTPSGLDPNALSRDPAVGTAYVADPLVHDRVTPRWFTEAQAEMRRVGEHASELQPPVLLFVGDADRITGPAEDRAFFDRLSVDHRTIREWPGAYHELLNETNREAVLAELLAWLRPRLSA